MRFGVKLGKKSNNNTSEVYVMIEKKSGMDPKAKALAILFILLVSGVVIGILISVVSLNFLENRVGSGDLIKALWRPFANNFTLETIMICMNLSLLLGLLISYMGSFRKTSSGFLLGLVLFLTVLFVQSVLSLPILDLIITIGSVDARMGFSSILISYQSAIFSFISNIFETIALIILYYLSME